MNFVQTIESDKLVSIFDLPAVLLGRKVEVIIRPLADTGKKDTAYGCLSKYANPSLISKECGAWERVVKANHEAG